MDNFSDIDNASSLMVEICMSLLIVTQMAYFSCKPKMATSPVMLHELENTGIAVGISLLCIQADTYVFPYPRLFNGRQL